MELIRDVSRGDWLLARAGEFGTVGSVAGVGFGAYVRILHPVDAHREDRSRLDEHDEHPVLESSVWRWAEVAARTGATMHPLVQWTSLTGRTDEEDISFDDGWRIELPEEGWFEPRLLAALTEHLAAATSTPDDLVGAIWDGWGDVQGNYTVAVGWQGPDAPTAAERSEMLAHAARLQAEHDRKQQELRASLAGPRFAWPDREAFLLSMTLPQLADPSWMDDARIIGTYLDVGHTPQMLWPEDRAWVLASEIDWDSTVVAGPRSLIDAVLADDRFEAYEVGPDDFLE
ncbi:hypothetical protein [Curtobacterium sp. PhB115]|uniref:hypothetical protein n=1 Tax=Curtobacterium sp. PhB115 TaxID=2485173 RepID=UPI000F4CEA37|nr:hypothetical protein [Curtobacterium sp. PhB115]ROP74016.1 hypothetical protein EDF19_0089 [Curtobacterium sp. PhB115]